MLWLEDIDVLVQGGVDIIVIDGIQCQCLVLVLVLLVEIYQLGKVVMVDCLFFDDVFECWQLGVEIVGMIFFGYIVEEMLDELDLVLV